MQIQISIIDVSQPYKVTTQKGGYNVIEVAFKQDGKVAGKKILDFASKAIYKFVEGGGLKVGETYTVEMEKDKNDYWQWITIGAASDVGTATTGKVASPAATPAGVQSSGRPSGRVTGSNYETPEERARRQVLIVRQSSLTAALTLSIHNNPKVQVPADIIMDLAEAFVDFVFKKEDPVEAIQNMKDDIPV